MTAELAALSALVLLHFATIVVAQQSLTADIGMDGNTGTREGMEARLSPKTQRLRRAVANSVENIGPFIAAVLVVTLSGQSSPVTAALAWIYVLARALYVPAYTCGWVPWRTVIWSVGAFSTLGLLLAAWL